MLDIESATLSLIGMIFNMFESKFVNMGSLNLMPLHVENCVCPLCESTHVYEKNYSFHPYRVVQCRDCQLWYLNPRLSEKDMLSQYSDDAYFEGSDGINEGYSDYSEQEKSLRPTFSRFLSLLNRQQLTGGDLLEVGCGYGYLLDEAKPYFNQRVGTDFSLGAVNKASLYADEIFHGGVNEIPQGKTFDCIISVEVIEHIYDPKTFVEDLYKRLKPGGYLILATPDMGSFWRKGMQKRWPSFKLPEHITYYDDGTLRKLYKDCGFEDMQNLPFPHAFPLSVFFEKLKLDFLPCPKMNIWFPHVVLGMSARRPYE